MAVIVFLLSGLSLNTAASLKFVSHLYISTFSGLTTRTQSDTGVSADSVSMPVEQQTPAKTIKMKKKPKTVKKQDGTQPSDGSLYDDDSDDNDMYNSYEKWRIDKFDNWGKHKKKNTIINEPDTLDVDTVKAGKEKGFSDKDKESLLIFLRKAVPEFRSLFVSVGPLMMVERIRTKFAPISFQQAILLRSC